MKVQFLPLQTGRVNLYRKIYGRQNMSVASALLPLLILLVCGAVVIALVCYLSRKRKKQNGQHGLPTDPLAYLFVDRPEE